MTRAFEVIIAPTPSQRVALKSGMGPTGWLWKSPSQRRMVSDLERSGLVRWSGWTCRTTVAGQLALLAKPSKAAWVPYQPCSPETAHAVRRLKVCAVCNGLCDDPPTIASGESGHVACFVLRDGWSALAGCSHEAVDRIRLPDMIYLGLRLSDLDALDEMRSVSCRVGGKHNGPCHEC